MVVTPLPIVTELKPLQPKNASFPMLVTPLPIVTDVKLVQSLNACILMLVVVYSCPLTINLLGMSSSVGLPTGPVIVAVLSVSFNEKVNAYFGFFPTKVSLGV